MNGPKFKPEQWVMYKQGEAGGFGEIRGGFFDGETWLYSVYGPVIDTTFASVQQEEITHIYESGSWIEAHHETGGQSSAYTEQS